MTDDYLQQFIGRLSQLYADPEIKEIPELRAALLSCASAINADQPFDQAVTDLSHAVSKYYVAHHVVPAGLMQLYRDIQSDVKAGKIDAAKYRKINLAVGLSALPIMFGGM